LRTALRALRADNTRVARRGAYSQLWGVLSGMSERLAERSRWGRACNFSDRRRI